MSARKLRQLWNVWSYWSKGGSPGEHITHAFEQTECGRTPERTLCGRKITRNWEQGLLHVPKETQPGCLRCRRLLRKHGLLK